MTRQAVSHFKPFILEDLDCELKPCVAGKGDQTEMGKDQKGNQRAQPRAPTAPDSRNGEPKSDGTEDKRQKIPKEFQIGRRGQRNNGERQGVISGTAVELLF